MSEPKLPEIKIDDQETIEIDAKVEEVPEASMVEQTGYVNSSEEEKEETVVTNGLTEGDTNVAMDGTTNEEGTDEHSANEYVSEANGEALALETSFIVSEEAFELQKNAVKSETQQKEEVEGVKEVPIESKEERESGESKLSTAMSSVTHSLSQKINLSESFEVELPVSQALAEEDVETHPLDELTDMQVLELINDIVLENRHLELENFLFEEFLQENDPSLLEGLDEIMNFLIKISITNGSLDEKPDKALITLDRQKFKLDSYTSLTSIAQGKGPKINISQKTDMLTRAMEEAQANLAIFYQKAHVVMRNLKSELEELNIRESEIKEGTEIFEFSVVTQGLDHLTQRIPAEKFVRYMVEWLKSAQLQIEKLRLRIATLKAQYKRVSQQLIQRQELGQNVHAVDFDRLLIENKHCMEKIEQKSIHLVELKKMNGAANLVLSTHKKFLHNLQTGCNNLQEEIKFKNNEIELTRMECIQTDQELTEIYEKYEHCKNLNSQYTVPDVMDYVKLKARLHELRKNIKIWTRRRKIQDIALNTCLREMKNLTGNTNINPDWFQNDHLYIESSGDMLVWK